MKLFSKNLFNDINTVFSFASALIAIVQLILQVTWHYYVITLGSVFIIWIFICFYRINRRPWHKKMRNPLIIRAKRSTYPWGTFFNTVFTRPYYEGPFISPSFSSNMKPLFDNNFNTNRLTVVVEDDPVGYAANIGMLPCIPVEDNVSQFSLYEQIISLDKEISKYRMFFIATPSRRLSHEKSLVLNREIGFALRKYFGDKTEKDVRIISKIDSCLRSNYEAEYEGLSDGLGKRECIEILVPSYVEQGRVTLHGCQYIKTGGEFKRMENSEFSSFKGLEYDNSDLALWMEKRVPHVRSRKKIGLVDIDSLRTESSVDIANKICSTSAKAFVFDTVEIDDLYLVSQVIHQLEIKGKTLFLKFGPSMINCYAKEYALPKAKNSLSHIRKADRGIFIAGSLTSITKKQIERYDGFLNTSIVTIRESDLENMNNVDNTIKSRSDKIVKLNKSGDDVILTTEYWKTNKNEYPDIQKRDTVLSILAKICQEIRQTDTRWFLLKGSDTALYTIIHGLDIKHYYYCGQFVPGVIHCKCQYDGHLKSFFIVGGNVGSPDLLATLRKHINTVISETE